MPINNGRTIGDASGGEDSAVAETEKFPVSGSKWMSIATLVEYLRTKAQTLTNKTLTTPTIGSFTNATHSHENAAGGGTLDEDALALTDVTTNNSSTTKHGFLKKLSNNSTEFMNGEGNWATPAGGSGDVATDTIWDAKGDLAVGSGSNTATVLTVGANGTVLVADSSATEGVKWDTVAGTGDVVGPASSTDHAIARYDGAGGTTLLDSSITISDAGALGLPDNVRQTFNPGANAAGINVGAVAGDPDTPTNGDLWYDSSAEELTARINGANVALGAGGGSAWTQVVNESGTSFTNFTSGSGTWSSDGTVIKQTNTGASATYARYNTMLVVGMIVFEAEIQLRTSGADRIGGLIVGFDGSSAAGIGVRINEGSDEVQSEVVFTTNKLAVASTIDVNTWYKLRVVVGGGQVTFYLDDTIKGSSNITPTITNASYIGLYTYQAEVWYRNIKAWNLTLPA